MFSCCSAVCRKLRGLCYACLSFDIANGEQFDVTNPKVLIKCNSSLSYTVDRCQFCARWRKRTRFVSWNVKYNSGLDKLCKGRQASCAATLLPHIILAGRDPASGALWSHLAAAYPPMLAHVLAVALSSAAERQHLSRLRQVCG